MNALEQKVMPGDLSDAAREHACLTRCLFLAWRSAKHGKFDAADQLVSDAHKSRQELEQMMNRKANFDLAGEFLTREVIEAYEKQMGVY